MYRPLTRRPIYRAFPELDQFSDDQCEDFLEQINAKETYAIGLLVIAAALVTLTLGFWVVYFQTIQQLLAAWFTGFLKADTANLTAMGVMLFIAFLSMCLVALITRDVLLRWFLHRRVTNRLRRARCRDCGYLLLGQRMVHRLFVHCPECGSQWTLKDLELDSPDDLLPEMRADD